MRVPNAEAALLLGGASTRIGVDKATKLLNGVPLYRYGYRVATSVFDRVRLIGHPRARTGTPPPTDIPIEPDLNPGFGPLGGVEAALAGATTPWVFVLACDHPFVREELIVALASRRSGDVDAVCSRSEGIPLPTVAFYRSGSLPAIRRCLHGTDHSLRHALDSLRVGWLEGSALEATDPDGISRWNLNTPEAWDRAEARLKGGPSVP